MTRDHQLSKNPIAKGQILMVCTSADHMGDAPTGCWASELAAPYVIFKGNGYDVTIASINGGKIPIDPNSMAPEAVVPEVDRFFKDDTAVQMMNNSMPLANEVAPESYDCIFLPGGHGAVVDMPGSQRLGEVLSTAAAAGKIVASVCHGAAGLVNARTSNGEPLVKGKTLTCFTNSEEEAVGKVNQVPMLLENRMRELGAKVDIGDSWSEHCCQDGQLITGQNPQSSEKLASLIVELLSTRHTQPPAVAAY